MTVLTAAILDEEKEKKVEEEQPEDPAIPVVVKNKSGVIAIVRNRRTFSRSPHRILLFVITLIGLLCALGGLCYGIYHFANLGHSNRHRVFCRVIEATSPMKRRRIISEEASMSSDGRSISLFTPSFYTNKVLYASSVVLILDQHGIQVIKLESRRQCFVKKVVRYRSRVRGRILQWFRRMEEGNFIPDVQLLHVNWMARAPHMSHIEAGHTYHPKVAEFCREMRVYSMVEIHSPVGVVSWGGGLLPRCPLIKCHPCPPGQRFVYDRHGCQTCTCGFKHRPRNLCPPKCMNFCLHGYETAPSGCRMCKCLQKKHTRRTRSVDAAVQAKEATQCEDIPITSGLSPQNQGQFEVDNIRLCPAGIV